jgi:hypothetical protein
MALAAFPAIAAAEVTLDQLDVVAYGESVHPVVEAHCATLDCHGLAGRPLRLYAETGLRLRDELRDTALTDEEIALDVASFAAVDPPHLGTRDHLALRKGLAVAAGGIHHGPALADARRSGLAVSGALALGRDRAAVRGRL